MSEDGAPRDDDPATRSAGVRGRNWARRSGAA